MSFFISKEKYKKVHFCIGDLFRHHQHQLNHLCIKCVYMCSSNIHLFLSCSFFCQFFSIFYSIHLPIWNWTEKNKRVPFGFSFPHSFIWLSTVLLEWVAMTYLEKKKMSYKDRAQNLLVTWEVVIALLTILLLCLIPSK